MKEALGRDAAQTMETVRPTFALSAGRGGFSGQSWASGKPESVGQLHPLSRGLFSSLKAFVHPFPVKEEMAALTLPALLLTASAAEKWGL